MEPTGTGISSGATGRSSDDVTYPDPDKKKCKFYCCVSNQSRDSIDMPCFSYLQTI